MAEYISRDDALLHSEIIRVYSKDYGNIDVVPVEYLADIPAADVQPIRHGRWITKAEDYYKAWQDSGRSWDDMPYFVTGLKFACSNCFEQFDVNAEGVEKWNGCPLCLVRMDGDTDA